MNIQIPNINQKYMFSIRYKNMFPYIFANVTGSGMICQYGYTYLEYAHVWGKSFLAIKALKYRDHRIKGFFQFEIIINDLVTYFQVNGYIMGLRPL